MQFFLVTLRGVGRASADIFKGAVIVNSEGVSMNRREQYQRKLEFIIDKVNRLPEAVENDEVRQDALYYRLQNAIDAAMDVVAMLCKDLGFTVKDDYVNLETLEQEGIFTQEIVVSTSQVKWFEKYLSAPLQ